MAKEKKPAPLTVLYAQGKPIRVEGNATGADVILACAGITAALLSIIKNSGADVDEATAAIHVVGDDVLRRIYPGETASVFRERKIRKAMFQDFFNAKEQQ